MTFDRRTLGFATEGLALFESTAVDAVLPDMVMPRERGRLDLARPLRATRKDFPVC
jgi:hypothetical protein